mmetsp:Transcript_16995/g.54015  ORF Transcript_16995/g.54015 Transcript_16995/m.54015 type:complete len:265 (+) Transcript_16995:2588-3382(+)
MRTPGKLPTTKDPVEPEYMIVHREKQISAAEIMEDRPDYDPLPYSAPHNYGSELESIKVRNEWSNPYPPESPAGKVAAEKRRQYLKQQAKVPHARGGASPMRPVSAQKAPYHPSSHHSGGVARPGPSHGGAADEVIALQAAADDVAMGFDLLGEDKIGHEHRRRQVEGSLKEIEGRRGAIKEEQEVVMMAGAEYGARLRKLRETQGLLARESAALEAEVAKLAEERQRLQQERTAVDAVRSQISDLRIRAQIHDLSRAKGIPVS